MEWIGHGKYDLRFTNLGIFVLCWGLKMLFDSTVNTSTGVRLHFVALSPAQ